MPSPESVLPLRRQSRYAGFGSIFWLWAAGNVLLANFIIGSSYSQGLGFVPMLVITVAAFSLGLALCSWNSQRSARYGVDEIVSLRPTFGHRGSIYGVLVLVGVNFGWVGILASLAGSAMKHVFDAATRTSGFLGDYTLYAVGAGLVLPVTIVLFNQRAAFLLSKVTVPLLLLFVAYIVVRLFTDGHIAAIAHRTGNGSVSWTAAFEIILAFNISWFPYLGSWNRFAYNERASFWGTYLGLGATGILFAAVGGTATLVTGQTDPAEWSNSLDLGIAAFFIILLGTVASVTHLLGAGSMGILSVFPRLNYRWACVLVVIPSIFFVYVTSLQELFNLLLLFIGLIAAPYWAVALVDYFLLRRQRLDVRACYDPDGPYRYRAGFNLVAFACVIPGMSVWLYLGGWMTGIGAMNFPGGHSVFEHLSATLPAMIVSGACYAVFGRRTARSTGNVTTLPSGTH